MKLFEDLLEAARALDPMAEAGQTFGWPAVYVGGRLVACVFGDSVCVKVPETIAASALAAGRFERFRPYGMPTTPQWLDIGQELGQGSGGSVLLREAVALANQFVAQYAIVGAKSARAYA